MQLSMEAYSMIVKYVSHHSDLATLCRVSKSFQNVAERALYNTLCMESVKQTTLICDTLANQPRLSQLAEALTIYLLEQQDDEEQHGDGDSNTADPGIVLAAASSSRTDVSKVSWELVARALQNMENLLHLNILLRANCPMSTAWILKDCNFQLESFHCDLDWGEHLVDFLNSQTRLKDLYILDYNVETRSLKADALPHLSKLECTYSEAAAAISTGRPITHLKTCFSHEAINQKRKELSLLVSSMRQTTCPIRSIDIADSSYSENFSTALLSSITTSLRITDLRYIGTLVLPTSPRERLEFYALLMRLPRIQCIEVEVSDWLPAPTSLPAFRALAGEIHLYNPTITRVIFVYEFDRTVITAVKGVFRLDTEVDTDDIWREV
ncbi:hypothetical protein AX17_003724 [Amanita inopinata Kibby_2008]|nr:hypothetical protein AX17_003724 [Amanita inopinata Kibby_2008]